MKIQILHVPDCPHTALLTQRLTEILGDRAGILIELRLVDDEQRAAELGMTGSPTLLIDEVDPFAEPGRSPSLAVRRACPAGCTATRKAN